MELLAQLLLLAGVAAGASAQGVSDYLKAGDAAFARGEFSFAISAYTSAIDGDSQSPLLYTKRAAAHISLRQQAQALRDLNKAVDLDDGYVQGYLTRGKLQRSMCNIMAAERDLNKVLMLKPDHKTATKELELLSQVVWRLSEIDQRLEAGDKAGAKASLAQLYNDAADCVRAQLVEARLWMDDKDYEQAAAATGRLLKSDPAHLEALVLRGQAYYYLNDHEVAKRHFGEALKHDPDYGPARTEFNKVKAYDRKRQAGERALEENDFVAARSAFTEGLHLDREHRLGNVALWAGLAKARARLAQHDEAIEAWDAVLTLSPGNIEALESRIRIMIEAEKYEQAVQAAREAVQAHQEHHSFHHMLQEAEKRRKMAARKDYYKILGVARDASEPEIKKAYRTLAKQLHPDKVSESEKKDSEARFRDVAEAYEVLTDEEKRRRFDNGEDLNDQGGGGGQNFHHGHPFQHFQQGGGNFHFQWG